jgi:hypothetical protein
MIIRISLVLFTLNLVIFVVRAEASERAAIIEEIYPEDIYTLQDRMSGNFDNRDEDALTDLGTRLLSWQFSSGRDDLRKYASDAAIPDHGVALVNEGACLNLKWKF